jgi:hypothetical protein
VKTTHKLVWLSGYINSDSPRHCFLLAIPTSEAIYHGFHKDRLMLGMVPGLPDPDQCPKLIDPATWKFPHPPSHIIDAPYQWTCSTASLYGVRRARSSHRRGIELEYDDFTIYLGDFRPSEALEWTVSPSWLKLSSTSGLEQVVDFYHSKEECAGELYRMEGVLVVWSCRRDVFFQIECSRHVSLD